MKINLRSISNKIILLTVIVVLITASASTVINVLTAETEMAAIMHSHMLDMAKMTFGEIEDSIKMSGKEKALSTTGLSNVCSSIKIDGVDSSYCYIVSGDGTMLLHPTSEKIGKPVENAVVTNVVKQIKKGTIPKPAVVEYEFNGEIKYASYAVANDGSYIVVISSDKKDALSGINIMKKKSVFCALIILVLMGLLAAFNSWHLVKPIGRVTSVIEKLAQLDLSENPLLGEIARRKDETGIMGRSVQSLQIALQETIQEIHNHSEDLHDASAKLSSSAEETQKTTEQVELAVHDIANGATSQANETQQATEEVVEMGRLVVGTEKAVDRLKTNANSMSLTSDNALQILNELNAVNQKTKSVILEVQKQISATNDSVNKIKDAVLVITAIAEETNLLSLNASIEAARAGEQGKGFAVVASEIQKLAEQSNSSAEDIHGIIELLLSESDKSIEAMERMMEVVNQQSEDVTNTEQAFREVKVGIDKSIDDIEDITGRMQDLGSVRSQVVDAVQSLAAIAEQNAASSEETSASVTEVSAIMEEVATNATYLSEIAESLKTSVGKFTV